MDTTYQDIHITDFYDKPLLLSRKVMLQNIEFADGLIFIVYTDENKINHKLEVPIQPGLKLLID